MSDRPGRPSMMIGAGVEVVAPDGRLLMIEQERLGVVEWSGTGGALEADESIEECALRETLEESGLYVRLERLIRISEFWDGDHFGGIGFLFLGTPDPWPQQVSLPGVDGITRFLSYRWCTREEVTGLERWQHDITHTAWPSDITEVQVDRIEVPATVRIRRARPDEADALTALATRAKAHWGYDAEFMASVSEAMTLVPADIGAHEVYVLLDPSGVMVGFHRVIPGDPAELEDMWVEPDAMGNGHGRRLFEHAIAIARSLGATALELDADPNAVGFYERMGMQRIGETPSTLIPGRALPRMRLQLP